MYDVISAGSANMDFIIKTDKLTDDITPVLAPGGSASNFAVGCSRLGLNTAFAGFVGLDHYGNELIKNFEKHGVKPLIKQVDKPTGIVVIFVKNRFKKLIRIRGANELLTTLDLTSYASQTKHLNLSSPPLKLLKQLKAFKSVSVDPSESICLVSFHRLRPYFKHIDVFLPNRLEIEQLCGCNYKKAAKKIIGEGCSLVVVKRRWHGCYATDGKREVVLKPFSRNYAIYTTGAGDAFGSAFITAYLNGLDLKTACLHGLASSHKVLSTLSSQNLPSRNEIKRIINESKH